MRSNRFTSYLRFLALAFGFLLLPALASAQDSVKCESNDGHRQYCGRYDADRIRMDRQISGSPCVQDDSWGVDREGLWVDHGCRAIFVIMVVREGVRRDDDYRRDEDRREAERREAESRAQNGGAPPQEEGWWEPDARAVWPPRGDWHGGRWESGGACFYRDFSFGGSYFCLRRGEARESLGNYGDKISSIRVFGGARAIVFDDRNFSGPGERIRTDVDDLRRIPVEQKPGHTWNHRISSIRVE